MKGSDPFAKRKPALFEIMRERGGNPLAACPLNILKIELMIYKLMSCFRILLSRSYIVVTTKTIESKGRVKDIPTLIRNTTETVEILKVLKKSP